MAYCVSCGVKLASGLEKCPLCNTVVYGPPELIGKSQEPLFPLSQQEAIILPSLDKTRKAILELVITFVALALVTLVITAFALPTFNPLIAIVATLVGGAFIVVPLVCKPSYVKISSWYVVLTTILVLSIAIRIPEYKWAYYTLASLVLYWILAVLPALKGKKYVGVKIAIMILSVGLFLLVTNLIETHTLSWSIAVALPIYLFTMIFVSLLVWRVSKGKVGVTSIVFSLITIASWAVVIGDHCALKYRGKESLISWSLSVAIVGSCLLLFLLLRFSLLRVRNYFHNRIV